MRPDRTSPSGRQETATLDDLPMGRPPETRKQALIKLAWIGVWLLYLSAPVGDLLSGRHSVPVVALAAAGLAAFVAAYLTVVFLRTNTRHRPEPWVYEVLAVMTALALILSAGLGKDWLVLFVYVAVACGAVLPTTESRWAVPAVTAGLAGVGFWVDSAGDLYPALVIPALLGGFSMVGITQLVRAMQELREARRTAAQLAATEERLRLARDLHDLLGHSLSLITLKSELAGRMLPGRPADAAQQVADIEQVSRQALVDVREAVSAYRRPPTLAGEVAAARGALASAGVSVRVHVPDALPGLDRDGEGALAWALREAATNVVRHSGAAVCVCAVAVDREAGLAVLTVSDDGRGPDEAAGRGNGLVGLAERLALAGGTLATARAADGGFTLRATVPLTSAHAPAGAARPA